MRLTGFAGESLTISTIHTVTSSQCRCVQVVDGMDVVRRIEGLPTDSGDKPSTPVVIADCGELKD